MQVIDPSSLFGDSEETQFFDPVAAGMRCCCGYELTREDDGNWRCSGGSHRYQINEGDVTTDKYGNVLLRKPSND